MVIFPNIYITNTVIHASTVYIVFIATVLWIVVISKA